MDTISEAQSNPVGADCPIPFNNSYANLPEHFFERVTPTPVDAPTVLSVNDHLARRLRIDPNFLRSPAGAAYLAGNAVAPGAAPIALAYAGHQFGQFVPQLGDGRAILLGEVIDGDGNRFDLQLKGSGPTRFSRRGDGRAAIGPVIREYIVSEAMAALGIPTTRSLAAVLTGERVVRDRVLPGAVLTRVASSHLRVGTFQFFAARGDNDNLRVLADYAINRHYPALLSSDDPYLALFDAVAGRLAKLAASWMLVGFVHGVLNTDNTAISGETLDYGPCAFLDAYDPDKVFSSIDQSGRYAFGNQPAIMKWNLARFAESLLPLIADGREGAVAAADSSLAGFDAMYNEAFIAGLRRKLGLTTARAGDLELGQDLFARMAQNRADFTQTFRALANAADGTYTDDAARNLFEDSAVFDEWAQRWHARLELEGQTSEGRRALMRSANPMFIPRNHRIEAAIREAEAGNYDLFHRLVDVLSRPYDDQPSFAEYAEAPGPDELVLQTYCGT